MMKWILLSALVCLACASPGFADVVIDLRTKETSATTRPDAGAFAVSVSAVPGHDFSAKFDADGRSIAVSGVVEMPADGQYRVKISYLDRNGSGKTTVEVKAGQPVDLFGISDGSTTKTFVMTLKAG